jgi:lysophospholipase L1-like esterase
MRDRAGWGALILLAAGVAAFWTARARYESRLREQIWPALAPEFSVITQVAPASDRTVMLLGDSRMAQWGLPAFRRWRVVNAGAGGLTTGQVLLVTPRLLEEYRPDVLVVEAGINDLKFLGLRPGMKSTVASLAAGNLTAIASEGMKHHCQVILLETWPAGRPDWARRLVWNAAIPASVAELNTQLRKLDAPGRGIRVINLLQEAGLKPEAELYFDTLHFKQGVYQKLSPALGKVLNQTPPPSR